MFHAFRGELDALDNAPGPKSTERLEWDVRKGLSTLKSHPWIPTEGPDAITRYRGRHSPHPGPAHSHVSMTRLFVAASVGSSTTWTRAC